MIDNVCGDPIGLRIEDDTGSVAPDNTMRLPLLRVRLHVGYATHDDVIDKVTRSFPMNG